MGQITGKVWGNTMAIHEGESFGVHRIEIKKGGFCSKHLHKHKNNLFYVESGRLEISIWKNSYDLIDKTILEAGDSTIVRAGEFHQFDATKDTVAFEIYFLDPLGPSDIERESVGGQK